MHPYSSIDVTAAWKKLRFILSVRSDFHIIDSLLIAVHRGTQTTGLVVMIGRYSKIVNMGQRKGIQRKSAVLFQVDRR